METNKEDREICVKVNSFDFEMPYCKLKRWFDQEGGWIFRGENLKSYKETNDSTERHATDKRDLILDLAKEFTASIDEALRDAYYSDSRSLPIGNENMTEGEDNQHVVWAIKYTALINKVRNQFKARVTDDNDEFCERHKEDSIVQGNIHNALLPKGVLPVPLYGYDCIGIGAKKRWLLIPYTTYSFMDNLAAALNINRYRLEDCTDNSLTGRTALRLDEFVCSSKATYVAVKIVFFEEMRPVVDEYLNKNNL